MEGKGLVSKYGSPGGLYFIGKKCQKLIEPTILVQNTVSIVPIIGEYNGLSEIYATEPDKNVRHREVF